MSMTSESAGNNIHIHTHIYIYILLTGGESEGGKAVGSLRVEARADDGKGLEAHFSERRRREFLFGFSGSVFAK